MSPRIASRSGYGWLGPRSEEQTLQLELSMSEGTVAALLAGGYSLYGFQVMRSSDRSGRPLVGFASMSYVPSTRLVWPVWSDVYSSRSVIQRGTEVRIGFSTRVAPGQRLILNDTGAGRIADGGVPDAVTITNDASSPFAVGLAGGADGSESPLCSFRVAPSQVQVLRPERRLAFFFATVSLPTGSVVESSLSATMRPGAVAVGGGAFSSGILIDFSKDSSRSSRFDFNEGWGQRDVGWATPLSATQDLVPVLINDED